MSGIRPHNTSGDTVKATTTSLPVLYISYLTKHGGCFLDVFSISVPWGRSRLSPGFVLYSSSWGGCLLAIYSVNYLSRYVIVFLGYFVLWIFSMCVPWGRSVVVLWRCTLCHLLEEGWCLSSVDIRYVHSLRRVGGCSLEVYSMSFTWGLLVFVFCWYSLCLFLEECWWLSPGGVLYVIYLG